MERQVADTLQWAGDHGGAFLWRRICRDLSGGLRVAVAARGAPVAERLVGTLGAEAEWIPLAMDDEQATLGAHDRLLGVHALLWATPVMAPMGAGEREAIERLVEVGAPGRAAVVLADWHVLEKMSDDPEAEGVEVVERARALIPEGWELLTPDQVPGWVAERRAELRRLVADRRMAVSGVLLEDALERAGGAVTEAEAELDAIQSLLAEEDAELEKIRARGARAAAHLLSAVRRETGRLQVDLGEFLAALEADLPGQVASVDDVGLLRHTLPHWLQHVVERWLGDRLGEWRVAVHADLENLPLTEGDLTRAELLVPAVQPPLITGERDWTTRIGATAALGGGAALLLMGLWIPGLVAVGGGLGWSAFRGAARRAKTREALLQSAIEAVRALGPELNKVLADQVKAAEDAVGDLGEERASAHREHRADTRAELIRQGVVRRDRLTELEQLHRGLAERIDAIRGAAK